jgi:peptidoglycan/LPS O-acetylase OafA/YrhL
VAIVYTSPILRGSPGAEFALLVLIVSAVSLVAAAICYRYVELPCLRAIKGRGSSAEARSRLRLPPMGVEGARAVD